MPKGYNGRVLHIDLTKNEFRVEHPEERFYKKYLGGSALNCYYLYKEVPAGADPLGSDNILAVSVSVTTGASVAGLSRVTMSAKSPLTGLIGDSQAGGFFPAEMKFAGYDAFIFYGQSPKPVYLWVHDGEYELRDAGALWGKETGEVEDLIKEELEDDKIQIAQIGPAGEREVRYAAIINNCNRANGRTGMGAVMGSKNLKAVVVRGAKGKKLFSTAYPDELRKFARKVVENFRGSGMEALGRLGTAISVNGMSMSGQFPTKNFAFGHLDGANNISGETMYNTYLRGADEGKQDALGRDTCYACPVRCKRVVDVDDGQCSVDGRYGGPEYETIAILGSSCGIDDFVTIAKANELCNRYGIDTISCGGTIAWAMECFENNIITKQDTDGIELRFGNSEAVLQMIELICERKGIGDLLALGSAKAAEVVGKGSEKYLITGHKQEYPAHMPRAKASLGLIYAMNPFGADHMSSAHDPVYETDEVDPENKDQAPSQPVPAFLQQLGLNSPTPRHSLNNEKVRFARKTQDFISLVDSICFCQFVVGGFGGLFDPEEIPTLVKYITGWQVTLEELLQVGERRVNLMRSFNAREGSGKDEDTLPQRLYEPIQGTPSDGYKFMEDEFNAAKNEYYLQRGWKTDDGNPTQGKLEELGLSPLIETYK